MKEFLKKFRVYDLVIIAMMAAIGVAVKPLVVSLVHIVTGPLFIPGGAVAGGFYMMWLVMGAGLVQRKGAATLVGLVQGIIVIATGVYGTHGIISLVTYTLPGLAVDLVLLVSRQPPRGKMTMFLGGIAANLCGVVLSNLVFFRLPLFPLMLCLCAGALSGALGGLLAWLLTDRLGRLNL